MTQRSKPWLLFEVVQLGRSVGLLEAFTWYMEPQFFHIALPWLKCLVIGRNLMGNRLSFLVGCVFLITPRSFPCWFFFEPQESSTLKTTHPVVGSETRKLGVLKAVRFRFSGGGGG